MKILEKTVVPRLVKVFAMHKGLYFSIRMEYVTGGYSFANSSVIKRGVHLHVQPCKLTFKEGKIIGHEYNPRKGYQMLLSEETRYNHRRFLGHYTDHFYTEDTMLASEPLMKMINRVVSDAYDVPR